MFYSMLLIPVQARLGSSSTSLAKSHVNGQTLGRGKRHATSILNPSVDILLRPMINEFCGVNDYRFLWRKNLCSRFGTASMNS